MPSSVIADIEYDADHARLTVTFTTGRIYDYYAVPADVVAAFQSAASKGAYFNIHIRDRYPFREERRRPVTSREQNG
jgi:lysyl-tRNA synthetase class 2